MPQITENLAGQYADAVINILTEHFPDLRDRLLGPGVRDSIVKQVNDPTRAFETIVTFTREWRLHPADRYDDDPWRVRLGCHKDHWTDADIRFSDSVNARLRAIKLEA